MGNVFLHHKTGKASSETLKQAPLRLEIGK